jgi:hypothetical protein
MAGELLASQGRSVVLHARNEVRARDARAALPRAARSWLAICRPLAAGCAPSRTRIAKRCPRCHTPRTGRFPFACTMILVYGASRFAPTAVTQPRCRLPLKRTLPASNRMTAAGGFETVSFRGSI